VRVLKDPESLFWRADSWEGIATVQEAIKMHPAGEPQGQEEEQGIHDGGRKEEMESAIGNGKTSA